MLRNGSSNLEQSQTLVSGVQTSIQNAKQDVSNLNLKWNKTKFCFALMDVVLEFSVAITSSSKAIKSISITRLVFS
jgi:hypothetical protein